ncbi:MAG: helix-turn-helix transcriptional regulator, partial [Acetatifactor sp.]|nr:helix-turn-helix transcriptional regulator [Acetatifactor sp.]
TIVYYIQNAKVEKAKYLLVNTHESVDSISNQLAFNTRSYFTQVFRQYTGITPSEYREKYGIV